MLEFYLTFDKCDVRFKIENLMLLFMLEYHRVTSMLIQSKFKSGKLSYVQTNDERFKFCSFLENKKKINYVLYPMEERRLTEK